MLRDESDGHRTEGTIVAVLMRRLAVCVLVLLLSAQSSVSAAAQQARVGQQQESSSTEPPGLPDSPVPAKADGLPGDQSQESDSAQAPNENSKPLGTAAAPYFKPSGIAAARPAGAAIAPAKQRRAHSFVIKFALIAGAAAAGGAIVALSAGSRSRP